MEILTYPNKILSQKAVEVDINGADRLSLPAIIAEMKQTMLDNNGLGLAAPQVGISKRFFIIQMPETDDLLVFINPKLTLKGKKVVFTEGCLSLPGINADVERYEELHIEYYDIDFQKQEADVEGLLAIAIQHENDHLDGILYIDRLSKEYREEVLQEYRG